jgi:lysophospholipase L1-like esterase
MGTKVQLAIGRLRQTMKKRLDTMVVMAATAVIASLLGPVSAPTPVSASEAIRIMPLGDSITGSPGCWRAVLWNTLAENGYTNLDFVGSLSGKRCPQDYDSDGEGHGGYLATQVATRELLPDWLSDTRPDIVLMHLGTNDVWSAKSNEEILAAFSLLVEQMRASNPWMTILVAKIIPLSPRISYCPECWSRAISLNDAIPGWAGDTSTEDSPITVVDQWTDFDVESDTLDGVHPNDRGNEKMGQRWYEELSPLLPREDDW